MEESSDAYRALGWIPEGKKLLGRTRRRWDDKIEMDVTEVGWDHRLDRSGTG
jgi:hypothetical protein